MNTPTMKPAESQAHATFLALMWGLTHPGNMQQCLSESATTAKSLAAIGEALLDLETSFYTPDQALANKLARTTARAASAETATYHFYPELTADLLATVNAATVGTMLYPNQGATIVIGCQLGTGERYQLTGPGIATRQTILLANLPEQLWQLRAEACQYPLGWDMFFVDGPTLIGIPRTTTISIGE